MITKTNEKGTNPIQIDCSNAATLAPILIDWLKFHSLFEWFRFFLFFAFCYCCWLLFWYVSGRCGIGKRRSDDGDDVGDAVRPQPKQQKLLPARISAPALAKSKAQRAVVVLLSLHQFKFPSLSNNLHHCNTSLY